jgi:hypothetical protein
MGSDIAELPVHISKGFHRRASGVGDGGVQAVSEVVLTVFLSPGAILVLCTEPLDWFSAVTVKIRAYL